MPKLIPILFILILSACGGSKLLKLGTQGTLSQTEFKVNIHFYYKCKYTYIDVEINQKTYTFLFDTGWDVTHIDKSLWHELDFTPIDRFKTTGTSIKTGKVQYGFLSSLTIGGINFDNIGVGINDMSFIKSTFEDKRKIYGIIGTNILRKAIWQIDYQNQTLQCANAIQKLKPVAKAYRIPMIPKTKDGWGYTKVAINFNGVVEHFIFDTGSYGSFTSNTTFLTHLENEQVHFERIADTINAKEKVKLEFLYLEDLFLPGPIITIENNIKNLLGNGFLEDYIVTIDWFENILYLQPNT